MSQPVPTVHKPVVGARPILDALAFVMELEKLKSVERRTRLGGGGRRENPAEHSWQAALMACAFELHAVEPVDIGRVVLMLLIHDVGEIDVGDTFFFASSGQQLKPERAAAQRICGLLQSTAGESLLALWREFHEGVSADARFAHAIDRAIPALLNLANGGQTWVENGIGFDRVIAMVGPPVMSGCPALWDYLHKAIRREAEDGWFGISQG